MIPNYKDRNSGESELAKAWLNNAYERDSVQARNERLGGTGGLTPEQQLRNHTLAEIIRAQNKRALQASQV